MKCEQTKPAALLRVIFVFFFSFRQKNPKKQFHRILGLKKLYFLNLVLPKLRMRKRKIHGRKNKLI